MDQVTLSTGTQSAIRALQQTDRVQSTNQQELATGRKDPRSDVIAELISRALNDQAADLASTKDETNSALNTIQAADNGLDAIEESLKLARSVAEQYQNTSDPAEQARLQEQFDTIASQIDALAADSRGVNGSLIASDAQDMTVSYGSASDGSLTVAASPSDSASLGLTLSVDSVDAALAQVRDTRQTLDSAASTLAERNNFTDAMQNNLEEGAADLVETDLNEDAAQALSLQTRDRLGVASLAMAAESNRAVLQLF
ncbi:flagellin [Pararhodospirillum oryzae]|uniref:Flagellin n=1 Tax=Pararhodospirillum oryzae TaxID=478448 RepID=A0A512H4N8_9PROT|nr:hypothetical protein [Pararhodospirillum oryzae]GEO80401.1 hypothetical protein ROR02_05320 [Pararhodospirillum oryzae]